MLRLLIVKVGPASQEERHGAGEALGHFHEAANQRAAIETTIIWHVSYTFFFFHSPCLSFCRC